MHEECATSGAGMADVDGATETRKPASLLDRPPCVVNIGLERFADDLAAHGATVQHVQWAPPAGGDARLADLLSKLGS
jgi:FdrA protein